MTSSRKTSLTAGVSYLLTFVSIPTLSLYSQVHDPNYVLGPGPDAPIVMGAMLEWIVALSGTGTAIALYSVVKQQHEGFALGFVASRVLEAATIVVGIGCLLTVVSLRQAGVGAAAQPTGQALVTMYDRMFLLGQSLMPAVNAMLLGTLLYRSRLVPRALPLLGLVGAPLLVAADVAIVFGVIDRISALAAITALPIALWEFSLGIWLSVKGFDPGAIASLGERNRGISIQ
jgi:hypothetical protein